MDDVPDRIAACMLRGIGSLFGGNAKPKLIITAFEEEALRQIQELRGEPRLSVVIWLRPRPGVN